MAVYLFKADLEKLNKKEQRKKIGNMYLGLNTKYRQYIMYSFCFYIQRTLVILVLVTKVNFGVQTVLIQTILLVNAAILYTLRPYLIQSDSLPENLNTFSLLIL